LSRAAPKKKDDPEKKSGGEKEVKLKGDHCKLALPQRVFWYGVAFRDPKDAIKRDGRGKKGAIRGTRESRRASTLEKGKKCKGA